jgi:STE24 endopeptidase
MIVATFVFPVLIMPLFNKFDPLPDGSLKNKVVDLAAQLRFPLTKIFVVDGSRRSSHSNAYMYGFFNNKRIVLYDTLLKQMDEEKILAVLCHEFGHWHHGHTLKFLVAGLAQLFTFCYGAKHSLFNEQLFSDFGFRAGDLSPMVGLQLFTVVFYEPLSLVLEYLMSMLSRRFEFQADQFAVDMGYGEQLIAGLCIMQDENKASITPDWLYAALHYSHPPLVERLAALERAEKKDH